MTATALYEDTFYRVEAGDEGLRFLAHLPQAARSVPIGGHLYLEDLCQHLCDHLYAHPSLRSGNSQWHELLTAGELTFVVTRPSELGWAFHAIDGIERLGKPIVRDLQPRDYRLLATALSEVLWRRRDTA